MIATTEALGESVGIAKACRVLSVPRSGVYRSRKPKVEPEPRPTPERALESEERARVRAVLDSEEFCDCSPREAYARLLERGEYYCHWRTMYTILQAHEEVRERRKQREKQKRVKPKLCARGPNQVWSWDITQLKCPWGVLYLYTIIDIFSRYVVGWMIADRESGELAKKLISETCSKEEIEEEQLTLHSDRGNPMRAKVVTDLMKALGVSKSHSRPYTPTDNPYSEAQFKTMKYRPSYPDEFEGITEARRWAREFFEWYNHEHHHTGLGLMTPATVHYGQVEEVQERRQQTLDAAYAAHPERFVRGRPTPPELPKEVWINQPAKEQDGASHSKGPAASDLKPGAQAGSRAESEASLDAGQHLAKVEQALDPSNGRGALHPKLEPELCQSP